MRVVHASYSSTRGGAARAAFRSYSATRSLLPETFFVESHASTSPKPLAERMEAEISKRLGSGPGNFRSAALIPGRARREIELISPDLVHLHWVGRGFLSIEQIGLLKSPVVWTLHDMWMFGGTRHYEVNPVGGFFDSISVHRKRLFWRHPIGVIAPTKWIADHARRSQVLRRSTIEVIPNPVPLDVFHPADSHLARERLDLVTQGPLIGFVSDVGSRNRLKGFEELLTAMLQVRRHRPDARLVLIGRTSREVGTKMEWILSTGMIHDDDLLRQAYAACDIIVVPSLVDNAPQSATEAAACGRPVVAFNVGGLGEVIEDGVTGFLAGPQDTTALADLILELLSDDALRIRMGEEGRKRAVRLWDPRSVGRRYLEFYEAFLAQGRGR